MEWLALEPNPQARIALKLRIHGYITRAEELKAQVEPATCTATDSAVTKASASLPPPKPERRRPSAQPAAATAATADGAATSDNSSDEDEALRKQLPEAIVASVIPTSDHDGDGEQAVLELPPLPYDARPASPAPSKSGGAGVCPSCGGAGGMAEGAAALEAREAWLREWEAALMVRGAELRRREQALEAAAAREQQSVVVAAVVEDAVAGAKDAPTEEQYVGDVEETATEVANVGIGAMELKEE